MTILKNPLISVIIPVYNVADYIAECLESVLSQSCRDIEVICVDDCGTDSSMEIVAQYAQKDGRVMIVRHESNKGLGPARNTGMDAASGEYVFFLDSDDMLYPDALERLLYEAQETKADVVAGRVVAFPHENEDKLITFADNYNRYDSQAPSGVYRLSAGDFSSPCIKLSVVSHGRLFSASFLKRENLRFINQKVAHEDNGFFCKYMSCMSLVAITDIPTVQYRIRPGSIMTGLDSRAFEERRTRHMKIALDDARAYISARHDAETLDQMLYTLGCLETPPYIFDFGRLFQLQWGKYEKRVRLLGLPLYRERINSRGSKLSCVLGIRVWKNKDPLNLAKTVSRSLPLDCSERLSWHTCNEDSAVYEALASLGEFYFLPNKGNMGDYVIAASEFQFLEAKNLPYKVWNRKKDARGKQPFSFVYGGGGIWVSNYRKDYQEFIKIFRSPHLEKAVILPSSFKDCDDLMEVLDERFTVFCREKRSFEYCRSKNSKARFILAHDMVIGADFSNFLRLYREGENMRNAAGNSRLLRRTIEKVWPFWAQVLVRAESAVRQNQGNTVGWMLRRDSESTSAVVTDKGFDLSSFCDGKACCKGMDVLATTLFLSVINAFPVVVTDRLHVAICAAKLGRQVVMLDNSYGKLSAVYEQSLSAMDNVCLTKPEMLEENIRSALAKIDTVKSVDDSFKFVPRTFSDFMQAFCSLEVTGTFLL